METGERILSVAVPRPLEGLFTYRLPEALAPLAQIGGWVKVPFGRATTHAFIVEEPQPLSALGAALEPAQLKDILEVGPQGKVVPDDVLALCKWAHDYYRSPLGEVLNCAVPSAALGLKNARRQARPLKASEIVRAVPHELTSAQQAALGALEELRTTASGSGKPRVALLHGVTGSGKTELYLELARRTLQAGKGVILLVPEIALTPQLHHRFESGLGVPVGLWHSALADGQRRDLGAALRSGELRVVVGARSAVFAPVQDVGLIVVDEEHDPSYKQEDRVRYHARDLAVVRGKINDAFVVLGSATPSLETRERVTEGRYGVARLLERVTAGGMPDIELVDLCEAERVEGMQAPLAKRTLEAIRETLAQGQQVMVFLNRRGFAAFFLCEECGEVRGCPNCTISLTVHRKRNQLICHVCGFKESIPLVCGKCQGSQLVPMGAGTESLEEELPKHVEGMSVLRLDRDQVTSATRLGQVLEDFRQGKANTLLGTQMLVKGHDFPGVTLVVVILADALFRWPDFRATERAYQILTQVAGRAGRRERSGRVLIQTFNPTHPVIQALKGELTEEQLLETERDLRKALGYPPFGRMARLRFEEADRSDAQNHATRVAQALQQLETDGKIELLGPSEAFLERAKGIYRWDLLIKSPEIGSLQRAILRCREVCLSNKWQFLVDVDPYGIG